MSGVDFERELPTRHSACAGGIFGKYTDSTVCEKIGKTVSDAESKPSDKSIHNTGTESFSVGRPFGSTYRKLKRKHNKIKELLAKKVSKAEIARLLGCD